MADQVGLDDIDRLLEDGMNKTEVKKRSRSPSNKSKRRRRSSRSRSRSPRQRRRRSSSRSRGRDRGEDEATRRMNAEQEAIERDRRTIFACQIHPRVDERDIFEFFSQCGKVRDVRLIRDAKTSKSKGLAYVEFHDQTSVGKALAFSGQLLGGYPISVQVTQAEKNRTAAAAVAAASRDGEKKIYISGVAKECVSDDLEPFFSAFGEINDIQLKKDLDAQGNQMGFVVYRKASEAANALQNLNGYEVLGQKITLSQVDIMGAATPAMHNPMSGGAMGGGAEAAFIPGISTTALDEGHGGLQLSANSRIMLMQRLQASGGSGATVQQPAQHPMLQMPVVQASQYVQLKNMFDPTKEKEKHWEKDIEEDVTSECSKFGRVLHCYIDKNSLGHVYLKFDTPSAAQQAVNALNGRWFAQKQIVAAFLSADIYEMRTKNH